MTDDADRLGDDDLRRLCEAHGIETAYDDIWGHRHEVSPEAMRALLRDMGAFDRAQRSSALPPYVVVEEGHTFPKLLYARRPRKSRKNKIYGPFASATSLRAALRTLIRIFRLRDCSDSEFANRSRPCINYQINICTAPCTGYITPENYRRDVDQALLVLAGHGQEALAHLQAEMDKLAGMEEFEQAARVRDQITALLDTIERRRTRGETVERSHRDVTNRDVVGWYRKPDTATISLLFVRGGNLVDSTTFHFNDIEGRADEEILGQFLAQFYLTDDGFEDESQRIGQDAFAFLGAEAKTPPNEVLLPFTFPEAGLLEESLAQLGFSTKLVLPQKGVKHELLLLAEGLDGVGQRIRRLHDGHP